MGTKFCINARNAHTYSLSQTTAGTSCPCCGQEIDWGVIIRANEEWKQKFLKTLDKPEEKQKLLDELDALNTHAEVDTRYEMRQTEATKRAIIKSNISYYLGNGWTKEELIEQGFFKPEDFDDMKK